MLTLAFGVVTIAALMGAALAILYLRGSGAAPPHAALPLGHGALGLVGFALLLVVLRHGVKSSDNGTGDFGLIAAGFLGVALLVGLVILFAAWRCRRPGGLLVATHASLAIAGVVVLLTLVALQ